MRTRFAPSLTGFLHLGHVFHMLMLWGVARKRGAQVVCRMEDHDRGRARPEFELAVLETMKWLGFEADEGLVLEAASMPSAFRQSDCTSRYEAALTILQKKGLVYGCDCSRKEIAAVQRGGSELCYYGACADKNLPLENHTVRFRVAPGSVSFSDLRLGPQCQNPMSRCGDFSVRDRFGNWTYQFACVCDDIAHGIDLVIRGEDLLFSTARQIKLFSALEASAPRYLHHPLLCDSSGAKLSKRQHSESVDSQRSVGVSADALRGQAAFEGGLIPDARPLSFEESMRLVDKMTLNW